MMAKQGMKRFYPKQEKNTVPAVPEISGKAKSGKKKANPLIPGGMGKVYHGVPHGEKLPSAYAFADNDLAVENLQNDQDMTAADWQDLTE